MAVIGRGALLILRRREPRKRFHPAAQAGWTVVRRVSQSA
jgi:hypothetical protein